MGRKIYLITTGEYSDYRVSAVCSTYAKAKEAAAAYDGEVETWQLDYWPTCPPGMRAYLLYMRRDGTTEKVEAQTDMYWLQAATEARVNFNRDRSVMIMTVFAKSPEHAVKIVNEKRTQLIANDEWKEG